MMTIRTILSGSSLPAEAVTTSNLIQHCRGGLPGLPSQGREAELEMVHAERSVSIPYVIAKLKPKRIVIGGQSLTQFP